jgi:phosphoribosylanthranilate isomerase
MDTRLKICGITNLEDALICVRLGVDFLGFNFYPKSPRYISPEEAKKIINQLPFYIQTVGILVQPNLDGIMETVESSGVSVVQIYGPEEQIDLTQIPVPVILGLRLKNQDFKFVWPDGVKMILIDSFSSKQFGGTGEIFDWQTIPKNIPKDKLILAGGINPENIETALRKISPAIIDVASGSEKSPGQKDPDKIKKMMKKIVEHNLQAIKND